MGEDRFKRFIRTVEQVTKSSPRPVAETVISEVETSGGSDPSPEKGEDKVVEKEEFPPPIHELITAGVHFLEKLSGALAQPSSSETALSSFLEKDKDTGRSTLRIPIPGPEILNKVKTVLDTLAWVLKG